MKLFLTSTIKRPNVIEAIKKFVGGFDNKKVVYIPTAANAEEGFGVWKSGETFKTMKSLCSNITILELEHTSNEISKSLIDGADILFVAGGIPGYLSWWLHKRKLVDLIKKRLKKSMIYIGTSAGAMVCAKTIKLAKLFEDDALTDVIPGMGLIDYEIWPHYKDEHKKVLDKEFSDVKMKRLRDGEFITIDN